MFASVFQITLGGESDSGDFKKNVPFQRTTSIVPVKWWVYGDRVESNTGVCKLNCLSSSNSQCAESGYDSDSCKDAVSSYCLFHYEDDPIACAEYLDLFVTDCVYRKLVWRHFCRVIARILADF